MIQKNGKLYDPKNGKLYDPKNENLYGYNHWISYGAQTVVIHWAYIWINKICRLMENYMFFQLKVRLNIRIS